jgi:hypothetical protein
MEEKNMTESAAARARIERGRFFLCVAGLLLAMAGSRLPAVRASTNVSAALGVAALLVILGLLITTYRFSRALQVGIPMSVVNTLLAAVGTGIPPVLAGLAVGLWRIYSKRTADGPLPAEAA